MDAALRCLPVLAALGSFGLSACSGPVESLAGGTGLLAAGQPVQVVASPLPDVDPRLLEQVRGAVERALERQGIAVSASAEAVLLVGLAERGAMVGVATTDGSVLAPAAEPRLLQNCTDRTYRLTLVVQPPGAEPPTRAWAEEKHCHATADQVLPHLAARAVAALGSEQARGLRHRLGRD